ncbi:MAG: BNR-4 repeat-containing protein [archaeon]
MMKRVLLVLLFVVVCCLSVKVSVSDAAPQSLVIFANNGLSEPFYWLTRPAAVYYNSKTYVVWHGAGYDPHITYYDHATKTWTQVKWVADNPMVDNGHGAPSMAIDSSGYIHVFYGATIAGGFPLKHAISNSPESISAFTVKPNIGMYNYPKPINIGNSLYLFAMGPSDPAYLSYLIWNGASWESTHDPIIKARSGASTYVGFMEYNNNKVHVTWCYTYNEGRRNVFYAYLDLTDMNMYSITGRNLGTTIDATEAETYCMARNTGADQSNTASMHFDSNGYPWIIYLEGTDTTWRFYHTRWDGSAWTAPAYITSTDDRFNYEDFKINSVTDVTAYLTTSGAAGPGGDIEQWHWNGIVWSKISTILSESTSGKPLGGANIPYDSHGIDVIFSQFLDDIFTDSTLKLYAYMSDTPLDDTPPTPSNPTCTLYDKWKAICEFSYITCISQNYPKDYCLERKEACENKISTLNDNWLTSCDNDCSETLS